MGFYSQALYKGFEKELLSNISLKSNSLILTIPGLGITFFIKKFLEKHSFGGVKYIDTSEDDLSNFNILDLNFDKDENALGIADSYFRKANLDQKFALVVNKPSVIETQKFKSTFLSSHIYSTYYFRARNPKDTQTFALEINKSLKREEIAKIYELSGGIGRFIKFLAISKDALTNDTKDFLENKAFGGILMSTAKAISDCSGEILENLGIKEKGRFKSLILAKYFELNPPSLRIDIELNPDLSFSEDGRISIHRLTKIEKQILQNLLDEGPVISKEKIAEIKWGGGSYDQYSDQAIGKTMQRLNDKLSRYKLEAIPRMGYKIGRAGNG